MSADREVELKFLCAPEDLGAVLAAAPTGDEETRELISVYFDTPGLALQKAGASLRVRESQGRRVQTLKRGEGVSREEHEAPIAGEIPERDLGPLRTLLAEGDALQPAFNVRVTRRQRLIRYGGAQIELALDQGEVSGRRRTSPISEVELELKSGEARALFELARELSRTVPLYISFDGKASRGQALVAGATVRARRRQGVSLRKDCGVAEAFQAGARDALGQIAANAVALREAPDSETVHQLRVAARRFRSAMSTFAPVVSDSRFQTIRPEMTWLAKATDAARNLDVFSADIAGIAKGVDPRPAGLPALIRAAGAARARAQATVGRAVASARFRSLMLEATAWVETGDWLDCPPARQDARSFAQAALAKRRKRFHRGGRDLAETDDAGRHHLRIEAKKLRYAAEGFAGLFQARKTRRFLDGLKALQDELGALNDISTAERLVTALALTSQAAFAAGELAGLRAAGKPKRLARAARALRRLETHKEFFM